LKPTETAQYKRLLERLREVREKAELSQTDLAKRLGYKQSFISKIERGELRLDIWQFVEWCRALKLDPHDMLDTLVGSRARRIP
jgi:transcriptional regulator with XRE-family HTH domain